MGARKVAGKFARQLISRLKLLLAKARHATFGQSSERGKLIVEQLELAIEDLEETQAEAPYSVPYQDHGTMVNYRRK